MDKTNRLLVYDSNRAKERAAELEKAERKRQKKIDAEVKKLFKRDKKLCKKREKAYQEKVKKGECYEPNAYEIFFD